MPQPSPWPSRLGDLLNAVVKRRLELHAYVLDWDFAMIYASAREFLPIYKFDWKTNRRLQFHLDDSHPIGASQHQKVVVIDDALAFAGGLDITKGRWDTPEHLPLNPRRCDGDDQPHRPYHDVQLAVAGDAAAALGDLSRRRWVRAGRQPIPPPRPTGNHWPASLQADITDVTVAIARTEPHYLDRPEVREVEALYLDAIAAAHRLIYIENQYFTAGRVGEALAQRLEEKDGPEVILVLPLETEGWLAQNTLDVMRERLIKRLQHADRHRRLRVYYPYVPHQDEQAINVHAKVLVVDDELLRVGSANLNNRSMGLDSECDLAIEACGEARIQLAISRFRNRLLGEHLHTAPREVAHMITANDSAIAGIETLRSAERSLRPLPLDATPQANIDLSTAEMVDPESPVDPDELIRQFVDDGERPSARRRIVWWVVSLLAVVLLAAAWRWTPLNRWLTIDILYAGIMQLKHLPEIPLLILAAYLIASVIAIPLTLLVIATILAFGPWPGFAYAFAGSILGALGSFALGRLLGRNAVRRLAGARLNALSRRLARRGILAIVAVRVIPVAPFTVINMVAGASQIRFRDFLLGTGIGMAPGIIAISLFTDRIVASIESPDIGSFSTLAAVGAAILVAAFALRRWLNNQPKVSRNTPRPS